jgi:hypothetical protein
MWCVYVSLEVTQIASGDRPSQQSHYFATWRFCASLRFASFELRHFVDFTEYIRITTFCGLYRTYSNYDILWTLPNIFPSPYMHWLYTRDVSSTEIEGARLEVLTASIFRAVMEAVSMWETSVNFYEKTRRNIPEDSQLHTRRRENLKTHLVLDLFM